ncbi:MAG: hypothetical protein K0M50_06865 [Prolixibacteraceae bacterium]|nr:hypothetical protein [Prolixibacteraceae bacterium]
MLAFMLMQVFFYGFIFEVTHINEQETISKFNYLFPALLSLLLLVVSLITPVSDQHNVMLSKGVYSGGPKVFFYLNYSKIFFRLLFSLIYSTLGFNRLLRYQKFIRNFSSNEEKGSLRWVSTLLVFSMLLVLVPLFSMFSSREEMAYSPMSIFFVLILLYLYGYVCLHVIKRDRYIIDLSDETGTISKHHQEGDQLYAFAYQPNYEKFSSPNMEKKTEAENEVPGREFRTLREVESAIITKTDEDELSPYLKKNILNRDFFDTFMQVEKPYLNADLRITDLVDRLHVNRTYISSFINKEYGVNFSTFINTYRLQEYKALVDRPEYSKMSKSELAEMAGFNSYRSFQRTEKEVSASKKTGIMT